MGVGGGDFKGLLLNCDLFGAVLRPLHRLRWRGYYCSPAGACDALTFVLLLGAAALVLELPSGLIGASELRTG